MDATTFPCKYEYHLLHTEKITVCASFACF